MPDRLRVLVLEDNPVDAALVVRELRRSGFDLLCARVQEEAGYLDALDAGVDVILSDYTLPAYDALAALAAVRRRNLDVPFIVVSGAFGDEQARTALQAGASDYLPKDRLSRLGPSIRRVLDGRDPKVCAHSSDQTLPTA
jgi:CheY-like chemotaxis protein